MIYNGQETFLTVAVSVHVGVIVDVFGVGFGGDGINAFIER